VSKVYHFSLEENFKNPKAYVILNLVMYFDLSFQSTLGGHFDGVLERGEGGSLKVGRQEP